MTRHRDMLPILIASEPAELLLHDAEEPCPYLPDRSARMPLRMPLRPLRPAETDARLAEGSRRHGRLLYRPTCPTCRACEAIRVDALAHRMSRTHRRVKNRGDRLLTTRIDAPSFSLEKLSLYEHHRRGRDLVSGDGTALDEGGYRSFLIDSSVETVELSFVHEGRLAGVAVTDVGADSMSAVYCFFDPSLARLSLGTYSILKQLELCRTWAKRWLYLGLYIADNSHMSYKARFVPNERLVDGGWMRFEVAPARTEHAR